MQPYPIGTYVEALSIADLDMSPETPGVIMGIITIMSDDVLYDVSFESLEGTGAQCLLFHTEIVTVDRRKETW